MDERRYDVLFAGDLVAGVDRETARTKLSALFKTDPSDIDRLFSGDTIVIKKGLDEATAQRYREAMKRAGALCRIRPSTVRPPDIAPADSLAAATVLPPGSLLPQPPKVPPLEFNLEGLTIAPPGVQLIEPPPPKSVPQPDVSSMTLAAPGELLVAVPPPVAAPRIPDTSHMTLAPAGTELLRLQ